MWQDYSQDFPAYSAKICVRFKTHAPASFHEGCEKSWNPELGSSFSVAANIGGHTTSLQSS